MKLEINVKKLKSGKFNQEKVDFLGFEYYAGYFTIKEEKKEIFKKKILKITLLTKRKTRTEILKQINNKVLGFAHYYKHCSCKKDFEDLDSFVRMRIRRYFSKNKDLKNKKSNLIFTNEVLKNLGLKSLGDIKKHFDSKKTLKNSKREKKEHKTGKKQMFFKNDFLEEKGHYYEQKLILKELKTITSLLKKKKV